MRYRYLMFGFMLFAGMGAKGVFAEPVHGSVVLPCGIFGSFELDDNASLSGQGPCTVVSRISGLYPHNRQAWWTVENLWVLDPGGYIGIDARNVSNSIFRHLVVRGHAYGLFFYTGAYYNLIENVIVEARTVGFDFYGGANQNTVVGGGAFSSSIGVRVIDSSGITLLGVSIEGTEQCLIANSDVYLHGVRCEPFGGSSSFWP